jgi:hypothetical protein
LRDGASRYPKFPAKHSNREARTPARGAQAVTKRSLRHHFSRKVLHVIFRHGVGAAYPWFRTL